MIKIEMDHRGEFKSYSIDGGMPKMSEVQELLKELYEEEQPKVKVSLLGSQYTFNTVAERTAWVLGFEACQELLDEISDPSPNVEEEHETD